MIAQKKKIKKEDKPVSAKKIPARDTCPKSDKDCSKCKILNCPEER